MPTIKQLDATNPLYETNKAAWAKYADFYAGGDQLKRNASRYLARREKEPNDVYQERLSRVVYFNYLGAIIDWYGATLYRTAPQIAHPEDEFYKEFLGNADKGNTPLNHFMRESMIDALLFKQSWILVDLPKPTTAEVPQSKAEEDRAGLARAYLVRFKPSEVLDWKRDEAGNLEWVKIKATQAFRPGPMDALRTRDTWTVYDKVSYTRYSIEYDAAKPPLENEDVALGSTGPHALTSASRVPFVVIEAPSGLWMADRAGSAACEHFDKSNALAWAIHRSLLAQMVVKSDKEFNQTTGESYFIQIGPDDDFGWAEPGGKSFELAIDYLDGVKDEIYRLCYLMTQAGGREAKNLGQSGVSKQRDYKSTEEVLGVLGDEARQSETELLQAVALARKDDPEAVTVRGLDKFDIRDLSVEIEDASGILGVVKHSDTFKREAEKRIAARYLDDSAPEVLEKIAKEIDAADLKADLTFGPLAPAKMPGAPDMPMKQPMMPGDRIPARRTSDQ